MNPMGAYAAVWTGSRMFAGGSLYDPATDTWTGTAPVNRPEISVDSSAVWTGEAVIVWGGSSSGPSYRSTGGRYDPVSNSWTRTALYPGSPTARLNHTTIWTGSHMIVWGGKSEGFVALADGGRYDPATATWSPTQTANAPAARSSHTAVWSGDRLIVWGGFGSEPPGFSQFQTGGLYDPILDAWTPTTTAGAPEKRHVHQAVWAGGRMVVWGGIGGAQLNTGGRYDPSTDTWESTSTVNAPIARSLFTAVSDGQTMIVWGGVSGGMNLNTGGRYDPGGDVWTAITTTGAPSARESPRAVWSGNEMIVWGGRAISNLSTGGRYDPVADSWAATSLTNAPAARNGHCLVWTGSRMIVWGGYPLGHTGGLYEPTSDTWIATPGGAPPATTWELGVWAEDRMLVFGKNSAGQYWLPDSAADLDGDGWKACAGDCNDTQGTIHPDAAEACNGIDDNCDEQIDNGVPIPSGVPTLNAVAAGGATDLSWTTVSGATGYDVAKGDLGNLRSSAGDFT